VFEKVSAPSKKPKKYPIICFTLEKKFYPGLSKSEVHRYFYVLKREREREKVRARARERESESESERARLRKGRERERKRERTKAQGNYISKPPGLK
jgi:hypothetical protein